MFYVTIDCVSVTELGRIDWETGYDVWNGKGFETRKEADEFAAQVKKITPHAEVEVCV